MIVLAADSASKHLVRLAVKVFDSVGVDCAVAADVIQPDLILVRGLKHLLDETYDLRTLLVIEASRPEDRYFLWSLWQLSVLSRYRE